jgi:5-methylcytosine-specific restriction endonuclease McrA
MLKRCSRCQEEKSIEDYHRDRDKPDGHCAMCKTCRCASTRDWRINNPERAHAWAHDNREALLASKARYRKRYREDINARMRDRHYKTKFGKDVDTLDYIEVLRHDPCAYCSAPPQSHIDHIVPVSLGGASDWVNLTAACRSCNTSKSNKSLLRFLLDRSLRIHGSS